MGPTRFFSESPTAECSRWLAKCGALAAGVGVGWGVGLLQEASVGAIGTFTFAQGLRPAAAVARELWRDIQSCSAERSLLQQISSSDAERVANGGGHDAGTLFRLIQFALRNQGRVSKEEAAKLFVAIEEYEWDRRLEPLANARDQAPTLGMFGTVIGLGAGVSELADGSGGSAGMAVAIGTALTTTLAGCAGAFVLVGLHSILRRRVDRHLAEVRLTASLLLTGAAGATDDSSGSWI